MADKDKKEDSSKKESSGSKVLKWLTGRWAFNSDAYYHVLVSREKFEREQIEFNKSLAEAQNSSEQLNNSFEDMIKVFRNHSP